VPITAHVFALIFGALAMITPPICVAAYTAAAIAGAGPMRTGLTASRLGFAGYVVPFLFVLHPAILLAEAPVLTSFIAIVMAIISLAAIAAGFEGWFIRRTTIPERALLLGGGLCLLAFEYFGGHDILSYQLLFGGIGLGAIVLCTLSQTLMRRAVR
jgi:TRAP-type uncharacterized transport system fused permease subunit